MAAVLIATLPMAKKAGFQGFLEEWCQDPSRTHCRAASLNAAASFFISTCNFFSKVMNFMNED